MFYECGSKSESHRVLFRYESGDHVAVFPINDSALVNKLGQILEVDLDVVISLNNLDGEALTAGSALSSSVFPRTFSRKPPPPSHI